MKGQSGLICLFVVAVIILFLFYLVSDKKEGYDYRSKAADEIRKRFGEREGFSLIRHDFNRGAGFPDSDLKVNITELPRLPTGERCFRSSCPESQVVVGHDYGRYYATCQGNPY